MKRYILSLLLLLSLLALAAPCFGAPAPDDANAPDWALQIRDGVCAEYMAVHVHHGVFSRDKERPQKLLDRALGDFSRESGYFHDKIVLSVMTWSRGGELPYKDMRILQDNFREAVSRYYIKIWPE